MAGKDELVDQFFQTALLHGPVLVNKTRGEYQDAQGTCMSFLAHNQGQQSSYFWQRLQTCSFEDPKNMQLRLLGTTLDEDFTDRTCSFISSKSDLLFTGKGREELRKGIDYGTETIYQDRFGDIPPLEMFMDIPELVKRCQLLKVMREGDVVIGKVTAKKPFGLFVKLVDLEFSKSRDFSDTNIQALCKSNDFNKDSNHREYTDPTDAFRIGDYIRGVVIDVNVDDNRIALSLKSSKLPTQHQHLFLGLLEDFDKRKLRYNCYEDKSYKEHLSSHPGLNNPKSIDTLIYMLGIDTKKQCSFLRSLQSKNYPAEDYFDELRRRQSVKWSMGSTAKGIEHFKAGEMNMALKYLDHALQIDGHNIEALVAKGALLANQGNYSVAVPLFRQALSINHKHKNAMKYLVETLIELGIQQEKTSDLSNAEQCFQEALHLQPDNTSTANDHLARVKKLLALKLQKEKESASKQESTVSKFSHVRRLIEEEEHRRKKKKKRDRKKKREKKKSLRRSRHSRSSSESSSDSDKSESTSHKHTHKHSTFSDRKRSSTDEQEHSTVNYSTAKKPSSSTQTSSSSSINLSSDRNDCKRPRKQ